MISAADYRALEAAGQGHRRLWRSRCAGKLSPSVSALSLRTLDAQDDRVQPEERVVHAASLYGRPHPAAPRVAGRVRGERDHAVVVGCLMYCEHTATNDIMPDVAQKITALAAERHGVDPQGRRAALDDGQARRTSRLVRGARSRRRRMS